MYKTLRASNFIVLGNDSLFAGIDSLIDTKVLSGGSRARAAAARAPGTSRQGRACLNVRARDSRFYAFMFSTASHAIFLYIFVALDFD